MRLPVPAEGWRGTLRASTVAMACLLAALVLEGALEMSMIERHAEHYANLHDLLDFVEWLHLDGKEIAVRGQYKMLPISEDIGDLLFRYFGIDKQKLESERRALLEKQRERNAAK